MKRVKKRLHPIGRAIEDVLAAGHTPRVQLDARRKDVTVPDHVRARWGARLIIDLDPSWPLAIEHTKDALEVDLAFQGIVERCRLGWASIYAIVDRATGQGTVFSENLPKDTLPPELEAEVAQPPAVRPRVSLTSVRTPAEDTRQTPVPAAPAEPAPSATAPADATAPTTATTAVPSLASSDEEARARRARFRVIAGGG